MYLPEEEAIEVGMIFVDVDSEIMVEAVKGQFVACKRTGRTTRGRIPFLCTQNGLKQLHFVHKLPERTLAHTIVYQQLQNFMKKLTKEDLGKACWVRDVGDGFTVTAISPLVVTKNGFRLRLKDQDQVILQANLQPNEQN